MSFYLWWIPTFIAIVVVPQIVWERVAGRIRLRRTRRMLLDWYEQTHEKGAK